MSDIPLPVRAGLYDSILPMVKTQVAAQIKGALESLPTYSCPATTQS